MTRTKKSNALTKAQARQVRKIATEAVDTAVEDKAFVFTSENRQLFHNKPDYVQGFLGDLQQGIATGDQSGNSGTGTQTIRIGDSIRLKNINIRFWLSNKLDRPNCMYKGVLFWYPVDGTVQDTLVYKTQSNKMLDRYNDKAIQILDTFIIKSGANYAQPTYYPAGGIVAVTGKERSELATLNKSWKGHKVQYQKTGVVSSPEMRELGFAVVCYDAYGTLQTDNIASYAYQSLVTFADA